MEEHLKSLLGTEKLEATGHGGGGCINEGEAYKTDQGLVFVKRNSSSKARPMFEGEEASLRAILETHTVEVPKPFGVVDNPAGGAALVMEFLQFNSLRNHSKRLGEQLARMHLYNSQLLDKVKADSGRITGTSRQDIIPVTEFGFPVPTCCGFIPMDNTWTAEWPAFYARNRLKPQIELIQKEYGNRDVGELWSQLQLKADELFTGIDIKPAILHGDLWSGNVGETVDSPVIFDPASFYGHSEYELGIASLFGGFSRDFYAGYHQLIQKAKGSDKRLELYRLFHLLNHWNHFGGGYKGQTLSLMKSLVK